MSETHNTVIVGNKMFRYRKEQNLATDPPLDRHELSVNELSRQLAEAREEKQQLKSIANNLLYWDTCPDHYKETIAKMYGWDEELKELQLKEKGENE